MNSPRGQSFQSGIVPFASYSHPLSRLRIKYTNIVNPSHPIKIKHMLCTKWLYIVLTNNIPVSCYLLHD